MYFNELFKALLSLSIAFTLLLTGCVKSPLSRPLSSKPREHYIVLHSIDRQMGTDIDHDAGNVNWAAVKSTGTNWVYCKVNGGYSNADSGFVDPMFATYWPQLKKANIARGAYCFFDLNGDGETQAKKYLALVDAAGGFNAADLPPQLDIEWTPTPANTPFPASNTWQDEALEWLTYVELKTGRIPIIYTGLGMAKNKFDSRFSKYPLWVARYPTENTIKPTSNPYPKYAPKNVGPWKSWAIWQYSENGNISGIGIGQDLDVLKGNIEDFVKKTTVE
ncbi:MAG: lysozyme [Rubritalea sp.]|jgi:lysozyme